MPMASVVAKAVIRIRIRVWDMVDFSSGIAGLTVLNRWDLEILEIS